MMPQQHTAPRRRAQTKKFTPAKPAADPQKFHRDTQSPRHQRLRIRKIFSRALQPDEVDFLLMVWKAGNVRAVDCPDLAASLVRRGWISRDGRTVRLSEETWLLLAEGE
jgi:hypothetical protein